MLKKTITYEDLDGNKKTEDFYFNLTRTELTQLELGIEGGLSSKINRIVEAKDGAEIMKLVQEMILLSYGERSADGKYFKKSEELSKQFSWTMAYDALFTELATSADAAAAFFNAVVPQIK